MTIASKIAAALTVTLVIAACDQEAGTSSQSGKNTESSSVVALPGASSTQPSPPQPVPPATEAALRGYFSLRTSWDQKYPSASKQDCVLEGASNIEAGQNWRLPDNSLVCAWAAFANDSWAGRLEGFMVFIDPPVGAQTAVRTITNLLPTDFQQAGSFNGVNREDSKFPGGSCVELIYSSNALGDAVKHVDASWGPDADKVSVTFYSGNETQYDEADKPYDPDSIHVASATLGGHLTSQDGQTSC